MNNFKLALRTLRRQPLFSGAIILTLALGIGVNTAMFSFLYSLILKPFPLPDSHRVGRVFTYDHKTNNTNDTRNFSGLLFNSMTNDLKSFKAFAIRRLESRNLATADGEPQFSSGKEISAEYFKVLGVRPVIGRAVDGRDDPTTGAEKTINISSRLWDQMFNQSPNVIGKIVRVDGVPHTVVGVIPSAAEIIGFPDFWVPIEYSESEVQPVNFYGRKYSVIARLRDNVSSEQATAEMNLRLSALQTQYPHPSFEFKSLFIPIHHYYHSGWSQLLYILMGAVALILLIACANVANLLLVRGFARTKELAIRSALGAGRAQIGRQLLTESLTLSLLGGAAGLGLGYAVMHLGRNWIGTQYAAMTRAEFAWPVCAFGIALAALTGLVAGLAPLIFVRRDRLTLNLNESARGSSASKPALRLQHAFAIGQIGLAMVLIVGAGLYLRGLFNRLAIDPGFRTEGMLAVRLNLTPNYKYTSHRVKMVEELMERTEALPGIHRVAISRSRPWDYYTGGRNFSFPSDENQYNCQGDRISDSYFETLGIRLLKGRNFTKADIRKAAGVIIVNEAFVKAYLGDREPIEHPIKMDVFKDKPGSIVGVVANSRLRHPMLPAEPRIFVHHQQSSSHTTTLSIHAAPGMLHTIPSELSQILADIEPDMALGEVMSFDGIKSGTMRFHEINTTLLAGMGLLALLLAAIGNYAVIAYSTNHRRGEFGIRMAIGAMRKDILYVVLKRAIVIAFAGVTLGCLGAYWATTFLSAYLYETGRLDPQTYLAASAAVIGVIILASLRPACKAAAISPAEALRHD
jgi:putative ABC transport system permease protein